MNYKGIMFLMDKEIIVILSYVFWDYPCDYVQRMSLALSKKTKTVFFCPLFLPSIKNLIVKTKPTVNRTTKKEGVQIYTSVGLLPFQRFSFVRRINLVLSFLFFRVWYFFKFGLKKPIYYLFSYDAAEILPFLARRKLLVYDRPDQNASIIPEEDKLIKEKDAKLLKAADLVLVNSPFALRYVRKYNTNSLLTKWGYAADIFDKKIGVLPNDLKKIKKPRLGLVGHIDHRLDTQLFYELADKRQDWNFILVGPVNKFDPRQAELVRLDAWIERLKKLPNVYFLGKKAKDEIPDYIYGFDVGLILYDASQEFVKGCNPMKLYEYLGMGKPVVSTPIEAVAAYEPIVKVARDSASFEKAIKEFLNSDNSDKERQERKAVALENSWEERTKEILRHFNS